MWKSLLLNLTTFLTGVSCLHNGEWSHSNMTECPVVPLNKTCDYAYECGNGYVFMECEYHRCVCHGTYVWIPLLEEYACMGMEPFDMEEYDEGCACDSQCEAWEDTTGCLWTEVNGTREYRCRCSEGYHVWPGGNYCYNKKSWASIIAALTVACILALLILICAVSYSIYGYRIIKAKKASKKAEKNLPNNY